MPVARRTSTDVLLRARLLLVMALAIYTAISTGQRDAKTNPTPAEKRCEASAEKARAIENLILYEVYDASPASYLTLRHCLPSGARKLMNAES